jgi:uncharacterized membrane protein (DUF4010 family)
MHHNRAPVTTPDWLPREAVQLALVLFLSFLVGLEREEHKQSDKRLVVFGGVRTFPFIGLTGYAMALLGDGELLLTAAGFLAVAGLLMMVYREKLASGQTGFTSEMAGLLTYAVGALVWQEHYWIATTLAVASLLLLELKTVLERLVQRVEPDDILAAAKFLLLTAVALPLLPNTEYTALRINPFKTWLVVVAVSGISYGSYVLQRLTRERGGIFLTAILGGAYSSTATTVALARQAAADAQPRLYAGAILVASAVMYLRLALLLLIFSRPLFAQLALPCLALAAAAAAGGWLWSRTEAGRKGKGTLQRPAPRNPLQLGAAFGFALLYLAVLAATRYAAGELGDTGVYAVAFLTGFVDVDSFMLGLAESTPGTTPLKVAAGAILIAAATNNLVKGGYAYAAARGAAGRQSLLLLFLLALAGLAPLLFVA